MSKIYNFIRSKYWSFIHSHYPYFWAKKLYSLELGKKVNFSYPKDINEKILWLEFYTDTRLWSVLADKYAVREYVKSRIGEKYLVPLLGRWNDENSIDFDTLPEKFVIKPNNGSYDTIIVNDKKQVDLNDIRKLLGLSLKKKFGLDNSEIHYLRIKPCIIAEKMLEPEDNLGLIDYKIWCFNGKPYCFFVCVGRDPITHHANFVYYDLQWNKHPEYMAESFRNNFSCPKPDNLDELLELAGKLSEGLPECRVDMYNVNGNIYFGEMTLTSNYGMMPYYTQEVLDDMGKHCVLPKRSLNDYLYSFINRYFPKF